MILDFRVKENNRGKEDLREERVNTGAPPFLLSTWHLDTFPMPLAFYLKYKPVSWSSAGKPLFSSYKIWKHCSKILITSYTL